MSIKDNRLNKDSKFGFDGQRDDEEILFIFRKHMISMRKGFYMLLIPLLVTSIPPLVFSDNLELFLLPLFGLLLGVVLFLYQFMLWYFTIYIVTDQRIRQITQKGFFGKDVVDVGLSKIQNISYNVPGLSGELFHFGNIIIQTFVGDLIIKNVEHTEKIYNKLQDAINSNPEDEVYNEEIN